MCISRERKPLARTHLIDSRESPAVVLLAPSHLARRTLSVRLKLYNGLNQLAQRTLEVLALGERVLELLCVFISFGARLREHALRGAESAACLDESRLDTLALHIQAFNLSAPRGGNRRCLT